MSGPLSSLWTSAGVAQSSSNNLFNRGESCFNGESALLKILFNHCLQTRCGRKSQTYKQRFCRQIPRSRDLDDQFGAGQLPRWISSIPTYLLKCAQTSDSPFDCARSCSSSRVEALCALLRKEYGISGVWRSGFSKVTKWPRLIDNRCTLDSSSARCNCTNQDDSIALLGLDLFWLERGNPVDRTGQLMASALTGCDPMFLRPATARKKRSINDSRKMIHLWFRRPQLRSCHRPWR